MATINVITTDAGQNGHGIAIGGSPNTGCNYAAASAGCNAIAFGAGSSAGGGAVAVGKGSSASSNAVAVGSSASAYDEAVAVGTHASASSCAVVVGKDASAVQLYDIAIGSGLTANGSSTHATGSNAFAISNGYIYFKIGETEVKLTGPEFAAKMA